MEAMAARMLDVASTSLVLCTVKTSHGLRGCRSLALTPLHMLMCWQGASQDDWWRKADETGYWCSFPLADLPPEALGNICSHLPSGSWRDVLGVCKKLRDGTGITGTLTLDLNVSGGLPIYVRNRYPAAKLTSLVLVGQQGCSAQLRSAPDDSLCLSMALPSYSPYIGQVHRPQNVRSLTLRVSLFVAVHAGCRREGTCGFLYGMWLLDYAARRAMCSVAAHVPCACSASTC